MIRQGLADSWTADSNGRIWIFSLRQSAPRVDGSPLTAAAVLADWERRPESLKAFGIDAAVALDDRRLRVHIPGGRDSVPRLFAEPMLAVTSPLPVKPRGTGEIVPPLSQGQALVAFRYTPSIDPRDALDHGVDVLVARDPAVVEYASGRPQFQTFRLPWSRTYVLLHPAGAELVEGVIRIDSVHRALARDVVQAEARAAEAPFWWSGPGSCRSDLSMAGVTLPRAPRIVYPRDDQVAKGLAERIVALAGDPALKAAGLTAAAFARALRGGSDRGYVLALPREVAAPCSHSAALPTGAWIEPLIDTRATAIVQRGTPPLTVDWDGTVRVTGTEADGEGTP
jgi:hypothetical protein